MICIVFFGDLGWFIYFGMISDDIFTLGSQSLTMLKGRGTAKGYVNLAKTMVILQYGCYIFNFVSILVTNNISSIKTIQHLVCPNFVKLAPL